MENEFRTLTFFCLLNFEHDSTIFPPLFLAYTFDVLYLIRQHNQPNTIRYLLCVIYYALCTIHYILCTMYYSLYTMHYALCTMHYALCIIYYALCTMHYALCIIYYTLCIIYYALCIIYYALCTMHYELCIIYYAFIHIHTYLLFYMYSYVFTISHGNPAKSRDFGTHALLSLRRVTLPNGPKSVDH